MTVRYAAVAFNDRYLARWATQLHDPEYQLEQMFRESLTFHFGRCAHEARSAIRVSREQDPVDTTIRATTVFVHPADFQRMKQICIDSGEMKEEDFPMFRLGFKWTAGTAGYEVSSKGDLRFSALHAKMYDGRTLEQHYQCDVKGYEPGGLHWSRWKGKPPISCTVEEARAAYYRLWELWAQDHPKLIQELYWKAVEHDYTLSDSFATSETNQAAALVRILDRML